MSVPLIEVCCDLGGKVIGASLGPLALKKYHLQREASDERSIWNQNPIKVEANHDCLQLPPQTTKAKYLEHILPATKKVADVVQQQLLIPTPDNHESKCVIVAGDHSTALGSIAGLKMAYPDKRIGAIWIDAHADLHSPYTTPSGNVHGMPVAASCALDNREIAINSLTFEEQRMWAALKSIGGISPKINLRDLVYIGISDVEAQELKTFDQQGVRHYFAHDVNHLGAENIANQSLSHLADCDILYVTFDVDVIDGKYSKGTGIPAIGGLKPSDVEVILTTLLADSRAKVFEIAEINPLVDDNNSMAKLVYEMTENVFQNSGFLKTSVIETQSFISHQYRIPA